MKIASIYIKYTLATIVAAALLLVRADMIHAVTTPAFPSCPNPGGTQIAGYDSGVHGIPGDSRTYTGSDYVFQINDNQVVQCFCPVSGNDGIKTDWLLVSDLSETDFAILIKQGWTWIPNGQAWGLADAEYLARNSSYSCGGTGGGSSGGSSDSGSSSSSSNSSSTGIGGSVLGVSTLANTGDLKIWFSLILLSTVYYTGIKTLLSQST